MENLNGKQRNPKNPLMPPIQGPGDLESRVADLEATNARLIKAIDSLTGSLSSLYDELACMERTQEHLQHQLYETRKSLVETTRGSRRGVIRRLRQAFSRAP